MNFYARFVELCTSFGKSPSRVALDMGFSKSMVSNWRNRKTNPTDATLQRIADYFGISVSDLTSKDQTKKPATENGDELDDVTREIMEILAELSPEELALAAARIRKIKESR